MKWTSLVLVSAAAAVVPGEALAVMPTGDSLATKSAHEVLAQKPSNNYLASATGAATAKDDPKASAELQTLEKRFFMHDFTKEPMEERLTRMEKFTFGETSSGTEQQRLARIASTLETHSADTPLSSIDTKPQKIAFMPKSSTYTEQMSDSAPAPSDDSDDGSDYPHITYLENEILGKPFTGSLQSRLARLETKAFGSPSPNPDLSARTDALERFAEVKLHKKAFDQPVDPPEAPRAAGFPNWGAHRGAMSGDSYDVFNGSGDVIRAMRMGAGGSFPDDSGNGSAAPARSPEDPAALMPTPPPEGARLLSRVAWCEQHLFNRTYPELHLLERLHQLNAELNPKDKEKDIQLMDHVDTIVKEVVLRQHPPQNLNPQVRS